MIIEYTFNFRIRLNLISLEFLLQLLYLTKPD